MKDIFLVGLGGFIGSVFRYLVNLYAFRLPPAGFPLSTLLVNLAGSLLIGLLAGFMVKSTFHNYQLFLITGFCGGFTTFSTFSLEGLKLLKSAYYLQYVAYLGISVIGGLALCILGFWLSQKIGSR